MVKDKSPNSKDENETPTKTREDEVKENGTRGKSEGAKETITPVVAKLAQKKARAQFFEESQALRADIRAVAEVRRENRENEENEGARRLGGIDEAEFNSYFHN